LTAFRPYLHSDPPAGRVLIDVFGQNRGTVDLPDVAMDITIDGEVQTLRFSDVGVGDVTVHTLDVPASGFDRD
ncbi:MAG TPA: hypothetical protein DCS43_17020, partial [Verrucomicrobia bacterium]|nr:hypothetical protein [Verrucomicrobiota bacterium]